MPSRETIEARVAKLEQVLTFVAEENPIAAEQIAQRIYAAERLFSDNPTIGRLGRVTGTRT